MNYNKFLSFMSNYELHYMISDHKYAYLWIYEMLQKHNFSSRGHPDKHTLIQLTHFYTYEFKQKYEHFDFKLII